MAAEQAVTVEVKQASFLGHHVTKVLFRGQLGDLASEFVGCLMPSFGNSVIGQLILEFAQASLGNAECFVDRIAQVGRLIFALEMIRLMRDYNVFVPGN